MIDCCRCHRELEGREQNRTSKDVMAGRSRGSSSDCVDAVMITATGQGNAGARSPCPLVETTSTEQGGKGNPPALPRKFSWIHVHHKAYKSLAKESRTVVRGGEDSAAFIHVMSVGLRTILW